MKNRLLSIALVAVTGFSYAQQERQVWRTASVSHDVQIVANKSSLMSPRLFALNIDNLRQSLSQAPQRFSGRGNGVIVSLPNADGGFDRFRVTEFSNMEPGLASRYPEIKSYTGKGADDPRATVYFSISPLGLQSMVIRGDKSAEFIEPYTTDQSVYTVYRKSDKAASLNQWDCNVIAQAEQELDQSAQLRPNADDGNLRNYRLAMSVTGEYTAYFGGTKALALAAINNTMTRVNGVFETDMGVHMNLISNTDAVIYTSASSDPYSNASTGAGGAWNQELQTTLTNVIGSANYDIGHLFGASGGGGNAGCIGCVCKNPTTSVPLGKGSGFTSPADAIPMGDNFDIDYVAHEMGHQFGGNHTFSMSNEGTIAQCEPGSGSTIMGYAGITGSTDVQAHSDAYFHAVSIQQITNYVKSTSCQTTTVTGNAIPTANAGADYTIPKGTPFILKGSSTDANGGALTYCWEQMDKRTTTNSMPSPTKTGGPAFRSFSPTTSPEHMFPRLETVKTGATSWTWEAVPTVARTLNFRFTVRDNQGAFAANNSDDMVVTVNATAGPFTVSSPNTAVSYTGGSTQTVTWAVAGTTANGVNCANVDILLSTDGGNTFPVTLLAATPNDGSQAVTIPNTPGTQNRIMVKGTNHIFFDMSNTNFTITGGSSDSTPPTAPTSLAASGTTQSATNLSWTASTDNVAVTGYDVYKDGVLLGSTAATNYAVTGLSAATTYTFYVKAKDAAGNVSSNSNTVSVTTLSGGISYCASQGNSIADERIGRVQFGSIDNSAATTSGYSDFTALSANVSKNSSYSITITPQWTGTVYNESYAVFIDYNADGDFADAGETVWTASATNAASVSGSFTIPTSAATGPTRMRVSMKYNGIPTSCEAFSYGEVEDYTVVIGASAPDTQAPSAPTNLAASGTTQTTTNLSWTASTDNVGVVGYDVYQGGVFKASVTSTSYAVTGLTPATTYSFYVRAKDAAGNVSNNSNTASATTLSNSVSYCSSQGNSVADEKIGKVVFGTISNTTTGGTGYENFTAISTNVTRGSAYTITITPSWTGTKYKEGYAVFIDWNQDGDFSDSGETVWTKSASTSTPVSGSITIPAGAALGATRMRVSMKYNGIPTSCETFSYGQVEDYTVNVVSSARTEDVAYAARTISLYPNPVSGDVLNVTEVADQTAYRIVNLLGQQIAAGKIIGGSIPVNTIQSGTYLLEISTEGQAVVKRFVKR